MARTAARARRDRDASRGRERAARAARHRRLDQRASCISPRSPAAPASRSRCERLNELSRRHAGAGRPEADRAALHGGSVRSRRARRGAARAAAAAAPRLPERHRARRLGERLEGEPRLCRSQASCGRPPSRSPQVGGLVALFGSLAPGGAILKRSAADARLFEHEGRAVVFTSLEDLAGADRRSRARRHAGRFPGAAERRAEERLRHARGRLPADPGQARARRRQGHGPHLGCAHERHRVRHDRAARHAGGGGRRAARRWCARGDRIRLCVAERRLDLLVDEDELARRRAAAPPAPASPARGYQRLYHDHVLPADRGCDFDFLRA